MAKVSPSARVEATLTMQGLASFDKNQLLFKAARERGLFGNAITPSRARHGARLFLLRIAAGLPERVVPARSGAHRAGRREWCRQVDPAEVPDRRAGAQRRQGSPLARPARRLGAAGCA